MIRSLRAVLAFTLVLSTLLLVGCPTGTTIADINRDPGRFRDKEVTIRGNVVTSFGALTEGAYEVDDGTGRIWVIATQAGVPGQGARVRVTGRVTSGVTVGGRSFGNVIRETERHTESSR